MHTPESLPRYDQVATSRSVTYNFDTLEGAIDKTPETNAVMDNAEYIYGISMPEAFNAPQGLTRDGLRRYPQDLFDEEYPAQFDTISPLRSYSRMLSAYANIWASDLT